MYAIVKTGGKQYRVQPGDVIRVEKLDQALGSEFNLTEVLMVGGESQVLGQPTVKNASVTVVVTKQTKDRKVIIFKKKRRQGYRRFKTHRQPFTELFVKAISLDGKVTKSETEASVIDVDQVRKDKILARTTDRRAAIEARIKGGGEVESSEASAPKAKAQAKKTTAKPAAKKAVKKTAAKKKKPAAKKASKAKAKTTKKK